MTSKNNAQYIEAIIVCQHKNKRLQVTLLASNLVYNYVCENTSKNVHHGNALTVVSCSDEVPVHSTSPLPPPMSQGAPTVGRADKPYMLIRFNR